MVNRLTIGLVLIMALVAIIGYTAITNQSPPTQVISDSTTTSSTSSETVANTSSVWTPPTNPSAECHSAGGLPDPACTPGATNPNVTQANIGSTICVSGWTSTVRPPTSYTGPLKIKSIQQYGYVDANKSDYEYDHLIPLEVGGNPTNTSNLWPEPYYGPYNSHNKDGFENYLNAQVCDGNMALAQAQMEIATNWVKYWIQAGEPKG